jgi:hypothetical protein
MNPVEIFGACIAYVGAFAFGFSVVSHYFSKSDWENAALTGYIAAVGAVTMLLGRHLA